jgi:hypothetical protein
MAKRAATLPLCSRKKSSRFDARLIDSVPKTDSKRRSQSVSATHRRQCGDDCLF